MLRLDRQPMQPETARIGVPYSLIGCSVVNAEQGDLTVSVRDSLGNPVSVADGSVTLAQPGVYSVIYGVTGSDVTLTYTVAVPRTLQGDWTQPENLLQSDNYYTTGSVTGEETLSISGSAVYLQQVDFDSSQKNRVKVRFDCSGVTEGQTFSIALKRSPGLADFNSCADTGLYFTFTATAGGISVKGIFSDGENTFAGWYADAEFTDLVMVLEPTGEPITVYAKWIASNGGNGGNSGCGSCSSGAAGMISVLLLALGAAVARRR